MVTITFGTQVDKLIVGLPDMRGIEFVASTVAGSKYDDRYGWKHAFYWGLIGTALYYPTRIDYVVPTHVVELLNAIYPTAASWTTTERNAVIGMALEELASYGLPRREVFLLSESANFVPVLMPGLSRFSANLWAAGTWYALTQSGDKFYDAQNNARLRIDIYGKLTKLFSGNGIVLLEVDDERELLYEVAAYRAARLSIQNDLAIREAGRPVYLRLGDYAHRLENMRDITIALEHLEKIEADLLERCRAEWQWRF